MSRVVWKSHQFHIAHNVFHAFDVSDDGRSLAFTCRGNGVTSRLPEMRIAVELVGLWVKTLFFELANHSVFARKLVRVGGGEEGCSVARA